MSCMAGADRMFWAPFRQQNLVNTNLQSLWIALALPLTCKRLAAGPKLRKWYGEGERMPKDGSSPLDDGDLEAPLQAASDVPRTAVLVTDADSPLAEQVVLQLILARYRELPEEGGC